MFSKRYPDDFTRLEMVIGQYGGELLRLANVERIGVGYKSSGGVETHRRCITVFVTAKMPKNEIDPDDVVPPRFHLHLTDVVTAGPGPGND